MKKFLLCLLLAGLAIAPATAHARLGETESELKKRYGNPLPQVRKDAMNWLFEADEDGGQLLLSVTFNAKGISIAEGLKPLKHAKLSRDAVEGFIDTQLEPYRKAPTVRTIKPGAKYHFGGQDLTCESYELVIVDETNKFLIVWNQSGLPSVVAVRPEMMR